MSAISSFPDSHIFLQRQIQIHMQHSETVWRILKRLQFPTFQIHSFCPDRFFWTWSLFGWAKVGTQRAGRVSYLEQWLGYGHWPLVNYRIENTKNSNEEQSGTQLTWQRYQFPRMAMEHTLSQMQHIMTCHVIMTMNLPNNARKYVASALKLDPNVYCSSSACASLGNFLAAHNMNMKSNV